MKSEPIQIKIQAQARKHRDTVKFCFICGKSLPFKSSKEWKSEIDRDHIVPSSIAGDSEAKGHWVPMLDVHKQCNKQKNEYGDNVAALLHKLQTDDPISWPEQIKSLDIEPLTIIDDLHDRQDGAWSMDEKIYQAAWYWVRGLHALLYDTYISNTLPAVILSPNAEARGGLQSRYSGRINSPVGVNETAGYKSTILTILSTAYHFGTWDGIIAANESFQYICAWKPKRKSDRLYMCFWSLNFRGLMMYNKSTEWLGTPWMGSYKTPRPPKRRQQITGEQVEEYCQILFKDTGSRLINIKQKTQL